jgi:4-amino-4-deoxy-L-arabinose transferase-like glycosyltransferase
MLNKRYLIHLIIFFSLLINLALGLFSGGAHSDSADYATAAIQVVRDSDYAMMLWTSGGREIINLWFIILVGFMTVFGPFNIIAILATAITGALGVFVFYKLSSLFFSQLSSLYLSIILALTPVYLVISHNSLYDALFIILLLIVFYQYFLFVKKSTVKNLYISGFIGSLLVFVHASGYPYILILWFSFFLLSDVRAYFKQWIVFSLIIGFLPLVQLIAWKLIYGSFFPYQTIIEEWNNVRIINEVFEIKHYIRFFLLFLLGYTPLYLLTFIWFVIDIRKNRILHYSIISVLLLLLIILNYIVNIAYDSLYPLILLIAFAYMAFLKKDLNKSNALVYLFGVFSIFTFLMYLRFFPVAYFHQKHFLYPVLFLIPIAWYYLEKRFAKKSVVFAIILLATALMFSFDLYFHLPVNKDKAPNGYHVKFSDTFKYSMPFVDEGAQKDVVKYYKQKNIKPDDYLMTNWINKYIGANLNMAQNHYITLIDVYNLGSGFEILSIQRIDSIVQLYQPEYIHWNISMENKDMIFEIMEDDELQLSPVIAKDYSIVDTIGGEFLILKREL